MKTRNEALSHCLAQAKEQLESTLLALRELPAQRYVLMQQIAELQQRRHAASQVPSMLLPPPDDGLVSSPLATDALVEEHSADNQEWYSMPGELHLDWLA